MSNILEKRQVFLNTKSQYFCQFLSYFNWKKCFFVTEPRFIVLRIKKD